MKISIQTTETKRDIAADMQIGLVDEAVREPTREVTFGAIALLMEKAAQTIQANDMHLRKIKQRIIHNELVLRNLVKTEVDLQRLYPRRSA